VDYENLQQGTASLFAHPVVNMGTGMGQGSLCRPWISEFDIFQLTFQQKNVFLAVSSW